MTLEPRKRKPSLSLETGEKSAKIKFLLYPLVRLPARSAGKQERSEPLRNLDEFALSRRSTSPRCAEFHANGFLENTWDLREMEISAGSPIPWNSESARTWSYQKIAYSMAFGSPQRREVGRFKTANYSYQFDKTQNADQISPSLASRFSRESPSELIPKSFCAST